MSRARKRARNPNWASACSAVDRGDRQVEPPPDRLGDVADGDALLADRVEHRPGRRALDPEPDQTGGVGAMDRGPAVDALADVGGRAGRAVSRDDHRDEAVVAVAVDGRGEADADRAHPALGERKRRALVEDPAARPGERLGHVALGGERARLQAGDARGDRQRPIGPGQRLAERLDRGPVRADGGLEVAGEGDVVAEREVDDAVALGRRGAQHVKIADIAAADLGAGGGDGLGGRVGAGEAEDLVIGCEQLGHDGGADPAGRAGDEYAHEIPPVGGATGAAGARRDDSKRWTTCNVSCCRQPSTR